MAGNDVFLYSVPSDADNDDVRLRDPTTSAGAGVITVSLSATEAQDTFAGTADLVVGLTLTATEAQDTFAGTVGLVAAVSLSVTEAQDVFAGTVGLVAAVSLAATEAQDTASGTAEAVDVVIPAATPVPTASGGVDFSSPRPRPPRHLTNFVFRADEPPRPSRKEAAELELQPALSRGDGVSPLAPSPLQREAQDVFAGAVAVTANDDEEALMLILALAA